MDILSAGNGDAKTIESVHESTGIVKSYDFCGLLWPSIPPQKHTQNLRRLAGFTEGCALSDVVPCEFTLSGHRRKEGYLEHSRW